MKVLLFIFSLFSRLVCLIKNLFYERGILKPHRVPLRVISVGSIALGGTEKTPLAMELLIFLRGKGFHPALVTRGYGGRWEKEGGVLSDGKKLMGQWTDSGDEPWMVARNIPQAGIFVGRDRLTSCGRAIRSGFDIAVLDDGFQHRQLGRDVDIVLYDPREKVSLREPLSALRRAQIILIKKGRAIPAGLVEKAASLGQKVFRYAVTDRGFFDLKSQAKIPQEELRGKKVLAFSGIANPERFFSLLQATGVEIIGWLKFADHFKYPDSSLEKIRSAAQGSRADVAITTEKDAVKLAARPNPLGDTSVLYLKVGLELDREFYPALESYLGMKS
jgi:tetraacyldisaccharide 4'-kinase